MSPGSRLAHRNLHHRRNRPALDMGHHGRPHVHQSRLLLVHRAHRLSGLLAGIRVRLVRPAHDRLRRPGLHGLVLRWMLVRSMEICIQIILVTPREYV